MTLETNPAVTETQQPVTDNTPTAEAEPDFANMTGAQAREWVAAQKQKEEQEKAAKTQAKKEGKKPADPVKEAAKEATKKVFKVKIDGKEKEVDEDELVRGYSHQQAANKKLQEGLAARKQSEEFLEMMRNPEKFFEVAEKLGHKPRDLAEKFLVSKLEEDMLDPKDKELRQVKAEAEQAKREAEELKKSIEERRNEVLKQKFAKEYEEQFVNALKETKLPATKANIAEMAKYIGRAAKLEFEMTAVEAARLVMEDITNAQKALISEADAETIIRLFGEETVNKIRKYDVSKLKNPESVLKTPEEQGEPKQRERKTKRMTQQEWRAFNRV